MASILPHYSYDIFISYRQKDNKLDGWVTTFVSNLKKELEAAFKEDVSIYFDQNPSDGILETHHVDETVSDKIKCLVFIPILSQTYCDPKSFAWAQEFKPFIAFAKVDQFGLNVKLLNGNTACRVLPVRIHELEPADKQLVETELGGVLRAIDFVYRSAGVVRTLQQNEEDPKANLNHTFYRDQMSKVVRGIKELISGMQSPTAATAQSTIKPSPGEIPASSRRKFSLAAAVVLTLGILGYALIYFTGIGSKFFQEPDKSIAVLPFENMNKDSTQDYFSNGIAEDILNHLVKIADLEVKSRTSTLQYKGTTKTARVIGDELGVSNIVEGSVRRVGNQVRIVVQLIDAKNDVHLWSETYDRDFKDVLSLQSEIAIEIAKALESRLTSAEKEKINKEVTTDVSAYDFYLQARDKLSKAAFIKEEFEEAMPLINQAIALDPTFSNAYALKANLWYQLSTFGLPQKIWEDSARLNAAKSISLDSLNSEGYIARARFERFLGNLSSADRDLEMAYRLNPKDLNVQTEYGYQLLRNGDERGADMVVKSIERNYSTKTMDFYQSYTWPLMMAEDYEGVESALRKAINLSPKAGINYYLLGYVYQLNGQYDEERKISEQFLKISPASQGALDNLGWAHFNLKEYEKAAEYWSRYKEIESNFEDKGQTVPFRHRLAMCLLKLGDTKKAKELLLEDRAIQTQMLNKTRSTGAWGNKGGIYYDMAVDLALLGFEKEAIQNLDSAYKYEFRLKDFFENDPAFEKIKSLPRFRQVQKKVDDYNGFMKRAFTNALNRAQASKELKGLLEK